MATVDIQSFCCSLMMQRVLFSQPVSTRSSQGAFELCPAADCLHPQLQWSEAHIPVFLTRVVCFDSQACLPLHVLGANQAQITLKWTEEWGKYSTQLCLLWGSGPGETCCYTFRYRASLASEDVFREPVCIYKNVCLDTKIKISPMVKDGNVKTESKLDGDKRFFNR